MRIAFVRPSMFGEVSRDAMRPLVFAIVKGLTPPGVDIRFFDERVERLPDTLDVDAVAMTVETFTARRAYRLADAYRARGLKVVMGGFHPTTVPEECAEHADAVVVGDAEDTWPEVVADLSAGTLRECYRSRNDADLSGIDYDHSAFDGKTYRPIGIVQFGRGCRFSCDFCSIHAVHGRSVRCADVPSVVAEIGRIRERHLLFIDDNLFSDEGRARRLCTALIPLRKRWVCQISMDAARDPSLLRLMRRSGCFMVIIGFESLHPGNLRMMRKGPNLRSTTSRDADNASRDADNASRDADNADNASRDADNAANASRDADNASTRDGAAGNSVADYRDVIGNLHAHGLMIYGTFVVGYDHDTAEGVREAVRFAVDNRFALANFNPLMPMPGTRLYGRLAAEDRLLHDRWWLDETYRYGDAMLRPARLTPAELTEVCRRARYDFNSYPNILRRLRGANARSARNAAVFLAANLVSRAEILAKQGRTLGGEP